MTKELDDLDVANLTKAPLQKGPKIFAVDADGTILLDRYPRIEFQKGAVRVLLELKAKGHKLILWTCRGDQELDDLVYACEERGLIWDRVNGNLGAVVKNRGFDSRKIVATYYLDDRSVPPFPGWGVFREWARKKKIL